MQVCPTGIDIRDGLQLDCISCGACIDVCDSVMDRMGYARGLLRYTSERALKGGITRLLRPRLVGYAVAMTAMIAAFIWALDARPQLQLDVTRDRTLYRENMQGQIENMYRLKLINKTQQPRRYALALTAALRAAGPARDRAGSGRNRRSAGQRGTARQRPRLQPRAALRGQRPGRAGQSGEHTEHLRRPHRGATPVDWPCPTATARTR